MQKPGIFGTEWLLTSLPPCKPIDSPFGALVWERNYGQRERYRQYKIKGDAVFVTNSVGRIDG
jgi:hypothetical protein